MKNVCRSKSVSFTISFITLRQSHRPQFRRPDTPDLEMNIPRNILTAILLLLLCSCSREAPVEPGSEADPIAQAEKDYDLCEYLECMKTIQDYILRVKQGDEPRRADVLARAYKLLGNVYYLYSDYASAENYYKQSIAYADALADKTEMLKVLYNLSMTQAIEGNEKRARQYADTMLAITPASEGLRQYFHTVSLGVLESYAGRGDRAIAIFDRAVSLVDAHKLPENLKCSPLSEKVSGFVLQKKYDEALEALRVLESHVKKCHEAPRFEMDIVRSYLNIYMEMGDTDRTALYQQRYLTLSDSLMNQTSFMKVRSAFLNEDARTASMNLNSVRYSLTLAQGILIALAVAIAVGGIYFYYRRRMKRIDRVIYTRNRELMLTENAAPESSVPADTAERHESEKRHDALFARIRKVVATPEFYSSPCASLETLSKQLGVNVKYISQAVNDHSGMNFRTFLNKQRIRHAQQLIDKDPRHAVVAEIAAAVGFLSQSAFIAAFKKFTDMTPSLYIRMARDRSTGGGPAPMAMVALEQIDKGNIIN